MTIEISQFFQVFFDEADELLAEMEKLLLAVDVEAPASEDLHAIFRTAHSIKGGAATFGLTDLAEVTHFLESLLDRLRNGEMVLTARHVDAFLRAKDVLKMQLDGHRHGAEVDQDTAADVRMMLQELSAGAAQQIESGSAAAQSASNAATTGDQRFRIELPAIPRRDVDALLAELGLLGPITESVLADGRSAFLLNTSESADDIIAICSFIMEPSELKVTIEPGTTAAEEAAAARKKLEDEQGYGFFEPFQPLQPNASVSGEPEPDPEPAANREPVHEPAAHASAAHGSTAEEKKTAARRDTDRAATHESSIRVGIEKVDMLINLVGELVITQAMIEQRTGVLDPMIHEKLLDSVSQLTRNTRDLQQAVMSIRMMPMDYVFSRFPRMVRDLATKLGKRVEFVTHGSATELDKGLIERIVDPLTHLVRNSIDHGIELPAERAKAGKSETGRLSLSAAHQGGNIVIEVTDDGGGLNREKILGKARQLGMPVTEEMPDGEVWQLILAPGFSTAEQVTDVSGRGVGMDVVRQNIVAMGGAVDIRSSRGSVRPSRFRCR